MTLIGCNENNHEHTFEYIQYSETHFKQYTCGCPSPEILEVHTDTDLDNECDVCSYLLPTPTFDLALETYYLPFKSESDPTYITFYEDGSCTIGYSNETKSPYHRNYWIEDGKVYLDIENSPKVHVFTILENAVVFDPDLSTANLWDTMSYLGPVIYFLPDVSQDEFLCTVVMAAKGLTNIPTVEKIYGKYETQNTYNAITNDVYAFMTDEGASGDAHSDKILGTEYTFTYSDSREILIYSCGRLLTLNEAYDKGYITNKILSELNENHHDCKIAHSYDEGIISFSDGNKEILYSCRICNATKTIPLPDDFSFALTYGFDLYYDSKTGYLKNGYNYDLDTRCETTLVLNQDELMNIYRILYNGNLLKIEDDFDATGQLWMPSYDIEISYTANGETIDFTISGASNTSYSEWEMYSEFCYAYEKVVNDFILSSEEYKSLPPNQNVYD